MSINLMPWRQERRKQLQKDFLVKIGLSAAAAIGCVVLGAIVFSTLISGEKTYRLFGNQHCSSRKRYSRNKIP